MDVRAADRVDDLLAGDEVRQDARRSATRNIAAFKAGYNFGETTEIAATPIEIEPAPLEPGEYRNVDGTQAMALGLIAASVRSGLQMFFASYPITPASELLHHLASRDRFGVRTVQAEDEIAAANMALGAVLRRQPRGHRDQRPRAWT